MEVQVQKRRKDQAYKEKKKGVKYSEKSKRLTGINVYITNSLRDRSQGTSS
jgi:hypothetical protein